jgi:hypothetical protein
MTTIASVSSASPMTPEMTAAPNQHENHEIGELLEQHSPRAAAARLFDHVWAVNREPLLDLTWDEPRIDVPAEELGARLDWSTYDTSETPGQHTAHSQRHAPEARRAQNGPSGAIPGGPRVLTPMRRAQRS